MGKLDNEIENKLEDGEWESEIQMQVNEWSCAAQEEGILRPGKFTNGRRTSSKLVYPVVVCDETECGYPTVIGIVLTGLAGKSTFYGFKKEDLPEPLKTLLKHIEGFEHLPPEIQWDSNVVFDLFLEARYGLVLLPEDVHFAREHGWAKLMGEVRCGNRSTHRVAVSKLGRLAMWSVAQKSAYSKLKSEINLP